MTREMKMSSGDPHKADLRMVLEYLGVELEDVNFDEVVWTEALSREYAVQCAFDVLHIFEAARHRDMRPRMAIYSAIAGKPQARVKAAMRARKAAWQVGWHTAEGAAAMSASWAANGWMLEAAHAASEAVLRHDGVEAAVELNERQYVRLMNFLESARRHTGGGR